MQNAGLTWHDSILTVQCEAGQLPEAAYSGQLSIRQQLTADTCGRQADKQGGWVEQWGEAGP